MNQLLEDFITQVEHDAIERVLASRDIRFDKLVAIAGLDPKKDFTHSDLRGLNFCGADVRDYNFSCSDLRDIAIDANTQIDQTTILTGAKVRWIDEGDLQIVEVMASVQRSSNRKERLRSLSELAKRFGKTDHVVQFVVNAASETDDLDCFLDFLDFLPPKLDQNHVELLVAQGEKTLRKKLSKAQSRTGRSKTKIFTVESIIKHLERSSESFSMSWYHELAATVDAPSEVKGFALRVEGNDLVSSLRNLATKRTK